MSENCENYLDFYSKQSIIENEDRRDKMTIKAIEEKYNNDYNLIIRLYTMNKLYLTHYQFNKFLEKRGEKKYPHYELKGIKKVIVQ